MPNNNCLTGLRCPQCLGEGPFLIQTVSTTIVADDGTSNSMGYHWNDDTECACRTNAPDKKQRHGCGYSGVILQFRKDLQDEARENDLSPSTVLRYLKKEVGAGHIALSAGQRWLISNILEREDKRESERATFINYAYVKVGGVTKSVETIVQLDISYTKPNGQLDAIPAIYFKLTPCETTNDLDSFWAPLENTASTVLWNAEDGEDPAVALCEHLQSIRPELPAEVLRGILQDVQAALVRAGGWVPNGKLEDVLG